MPENEIDKFFGDLPSEDKELADIFDEGKEGDAEKANGRKPEEGDGEERPRTMRQNKRLEKQLQWERENRIAAEARAAALAEKVVVADTGIDPDLVRMYGPENTEAARIHQNLLAKYAKQAEEQALQRFQQSAATERAEAQRIRSVIEGHIEDIEEEYGVDLSSGSPKANRERERFLGLIEKLSPKDEDGNVENFVDFAETWELYQSRQDKLSDNTQRKEIAARTMQKSGTTTQTTQRVPTPGFDGWKTDLGLQ